MKNIKQYLKQIGVSKQHLCEQIQLSRPTLDSYIKLYESGKVIPRERYQIIFEKLFDVELDEELFNVQLENVKRLLERDERLGTEKLDAMAADVVSRLKDRMLEDMSQGEWNQSVYTFIDLLICNYKKNSFFEKLAEYFTFLNRSEINDEVKEEQIPYFANFYRVFDFILKHSGEYDEKDYNAFLKRRNEICHNRQSEEEERKNRINQLFEDTAKELEEIGIKATDEEIIKAVLRKINDK